MKTYGRSPLEITEDSICDLHTEVCRDLNTMCGGRVLYYGKTRERLVALRQKLEDAILSEEKPGHRAQELTRNYLSIMLR